jgi:hypothetical protein
MLFTRTCRDPLSPAGIFLPNAHKPSGRELENMSDLYLNLKLPGDLKAAVSDAARRDNRSVSNWVTQVLRRAAFEDALAQGVRKPPQGSAA